MRTSVHSQQGVFLLEALLGILVFSLGVLAMVALGTVAISAQSDAQYRTEASNLANEIASQISLRADRVHSSSALPAEILAELNASLLPFQHNPGGDRCNFDADPSGDVLVTAWATKVAGALPGVVASSLQIDTTSLVAFSGMSVTVCWQAPADKSVRSHTLVTYVN